MIVHTGVDMEREIIQGAEAVYQDYTSLLVYTRNGEELEIELVEEPEVTKVAETYHIRAEGYTAEYFITTGEFYGGMSEVC